MNLMILGIGVCCLMPLSTMLHYIVVVSFIGGENQKYPEKTTNLQYVTGKLYRIKLYRVHLAMSGIQPHNYSGDRH